MAAQHLSGHDRLMAGCEGEVVAEGRPGIFAVAMASRQNWPRHCDTALMPPPLARRSIFSGPLANQAGGVAVRLALLPP